MARRRKAIIGQFARSSIFTNIEEIEEYINEQYIYKGELLETEATTALAQDATTTAVASADVALNTGRTVRFVKGIIEELDLITALTITVTVTRVAAQRAMHANGAVVLDADGDQVGVLSAAMDAAAATVTFTMTHIDKTFAVGAALTIDDETLAVTGVSSAITFARPTGNAALAVPYEVRDDNGPYALEEVVELGEKIGILMVDAN